VRIMVEHDLQAAGVERQLAATSPGA
jgi:hypothetical protein